MQAAAAWYPELIDLTRRYTDKPTGYRTDGTLVVAGDRADSTHLDQLRAYQHMHGMEVERLTTRQARGLEPALSPALAGAVAIDGDHQLQPRAFTLALIDAARNAAVSLRTQQVHDVGTLDADQVVLAAGLGAANVTGWYLSLIHI